MKINYTEKLAVNYNTYHSQKDKLFQLQLSKIASYLDLNNKSKVIDMGCGAGRLLIPLSKKVDSIFGIEKSKAMFSECQNKKPSNSTLFNLDFLTDLKKIKSIIEKNKITKCYFSYSIHQLQDKGIQLSLLNNLKELGLDILLITLHESQFKENLINRFFPTANTIDVNRFLTEKELSTSIGIKIKEINSVYNYEDSKVYFDKIQNKYISSLHLISDEELSSGLSKIKKKYTDSKILVPDFYTYYLL